MPKVRKSREAMVTFVE